MPWHVAKSSQCPASKPWAVIKDSDSSVEGCHPTKDDALAHMAALYANEPGAKMSDCAPCAEQRTGSPHHYRSNVDNSAWDATKAMSQCANSDTPASCYNEICAGKKAGDPATQGAHALPHHYPGKGPNATGTRNALSRLPQTDGLTNKSAAQSHLEAHMKQINPDYTPSAQPPGATRIRRMRAYVEQGGSQTPNGTARSQLFGAIFRAKPVKLDGRSGDFFEVEGYASVVDTPYEMFDMFGPYDEIIRKGAFDLSLANPELDTAFLVNHRGITMARTTNGTLQLWGDSTGLGARAYLNAAREDVRTVVSAIDDGLIDEMSFAFYLNAGGWNESYDVFTIFEADINRGDVSAVNYGANPFTSIGARANEILHDLDHLPDGAARAAIRRLRSRIRPAARALTSMDADESVNEVLAGLDATLDSASDLVVNIDPATLAPEVAQALDLLTAAEALADQLMDMLGIDDPDDTDTDENRGPAIIPSVTVTLPEFSGKAALASGGNPADATHGSYMGAHTHMHAANGAQGSDEMHTHAHSHSNDGNHTHGHAKSPDPGMSTELAAQLAALDDDYERDREDA